jgi:hypothetical protein
MILGGERRSTRRKTFLSATLSTTNPTQTRERACSYFAYILYTYTTQRLYVMWCAVRRRNTFHSKIIWKTAMRLISPLRTSSRLLNGHKYWTVQETCYVQLRVIHDLVQRKLQWDCVFTCLESKVCGQGYEWSEYLLAAVVCDINN